MGITLRTSTAALDSFFAQSQQIVADTIRMALAKLGEECVARVRDRGADDSWIDRTGNLRSSIGYGVYEYGVAQVTAAFASVGGGTEGTAEGRKMIRDLASQYSNAYALVVVAAMRYASYVEAIEGKDVLASTELWARGIVNARLQRAVDQAVKRINRIKV